MAIPVSLFYVHKNNDQIYSGLFKKYLSLHPPFLKSNSKQVYPEVSAGVYSASRILPP